MTVSRPETPPLVLGVDVGGTKVAVGALAAGGGTEHLIQQPTNLSSTDELLNGIEAVVGEVAAVTGQPAAIGVGVPSQVEWATGKVMASVNIPLQGVELGTELQRRFGVPVFVDNDANCAALAEAQAVEGGPARFLVILTLGTGVGGGLVIDGRIFRGASGLGAELGHTVIWADGPECPGNCPNRGCMESLCSGLALERDAKELARRKPDSPLGRARLDDDRVEGREVVSAARDGDPDALELLRNFGRWLGVGISSLMNAFEPEVVVLGGGLSRVADLYVEEARREAAWRTLPSIWARSQITLAREPAAGVVGAALLARQELERGGEGVVAAGAASTPAVFEPSSHSQGGGRP